MDRPLKMLYYNTFLPVKYGEGILSRQFLEAANQVDGWHLVTVPVIDSSVRAQDEKTSSSGKWLPPGSRLRAWRRRVKPYFPAGVRKQVRRALLSPTSWLPPGRYLYRRHMNEQLRQVLDKEGPFDVLLLRTSQADLWLLRQLLDRTTTPVVIEAGGPLAYQADHVFHRAMSKRDRDDERFLYERADAVIVISEFMKSLLMKDGINRNKIVTIPNGVDFSTFTTERVDMFAVRDKLDLEGRRIVGYVGGFWRGHDLTTLLKAWKYVECEQPDTVLLLVGDGPLRPQAQALSDELGLQNVNWVGRVLHDDVPAYMSLMNVAVAPYIEAAVAYVSPLKVIEYLAMGLSVVATRGGQITELIEHGVSGYTYEAGAVNQLTDYILAMLTVPEKAQQMGSAAKNRILNWYSWDCVARETLKVCQTVAN